MRYDNTAMPNSTLVFLSGYTLAPTENIGYRARELGELYRTEVPVPRSFCLPQPALKSIIEANNLVQKYKQLSASAKFSTKRDREKFKKQIYQLFTRVKIPKNIAADLVRHYHEYLQQGYVHILPSSPPNNSGDWIHSNVKGEANLIDSIAKVWAEIVFTAAIHSPKNSHERTILLQSPIIVEFAPEADASGVVYTANPSSGSKTEMVIAGAWGIYHPETSDVDMFKLDVRTFNLIGKQLTSKTSQLKRSHEALKKVPVPEDKKNQPVLDGGQIHNLARLAYKIKQRSLSQQKISWMLVNNSLYITAVEPMPENIELASNFISDTPKQQKTTVHLLVSTGNPDKAKDQITTNIDGIGLLRSEYTIAKFGLHPQSVLKGKKQLLLKEELSKTISVFQQELKGRPAIYRSQNFTSEELGKLKYAASFEPTELNPYLGYRGGIKAVTQPELFAFELKIILECAQKNKGYLGFMVPFVRTPAELRSILNIISRTGLMHQNNFGIWLQLNTPENLFNLSSYPLELIDGVSINVTSLHGLMHGIDPDDLEMAQRYPLNLPLLSKLIEQATTALREFSKNSLVVKKQQIYLHLEQYHPDLVAEAVRLNLDGVTVKPQFVSLARECIIDTESVLLAKK